MVCIACALPGPELCRRCRAGLAPTSERRLPGGLLVAPAFRHEGTARLLVHHLKYRGLVAAADVLARGMIGAVPASASGLVPVPRARLRSWRYGVDPALELARSLGRLTGLPVYSVLRSPLWWRRHAAGDRDHRHPPAFTAVRSVPSNAVLVDDVVTTGATLAAARAISDGAATWALTATSAV